MISAEFEGEIFFENRSIFAEVMGNKVGDVFMKHGVYVNGKETMALEIYEH